MDVSQLNGGPPSEFDLNDNDFLSNELTNKILNDNINGNYDKTLDGNNLNNNINTKVTFDNEIKQTYTINESSKPIRGLICLDDNNATGFETTLNQAEDTENTVFCKQYGIDSVNNITDIDNLKVDNTNLIHASSNRNDKVCRLSHIENLAIEDDSFNKMDVNENICDNHPQETSHNLQRRIENSNISFGSCYDVTQSKELIHETGNILISGVQHDEVDSYENQNVSEDESHISKHEPEQKSFEDIDNHDKIEASIKNMGENIIIRHDETYQVDPLVKSDQQKQLEPPQLGENILSRNVVLSNTMNNDSDETKSEFKNTENDSSQNNCENIPPKKQPVAIIRSPIDLACKIIEPAPQNETSPLETCSSISRVPDQTKNTTDQKHTKFLNTLKHMNEQKRPSELSFEEFLNRGRSKPYSDSYKTRVHNVTFADDERPLHTINYARDRFDDAYLSGYQDHVSSSRTRISPSGSFGSTGRTKISPTGSTRKQSPGSRAATRRSVKSSVRTSDGKENNYSKYHADIYGMKSFIYTLELEEEVLSLCSELAFLGSFIYTYDKRKVRKEGEESQIKSIAKCFR